MKIVEPGHLYVLDELDGELSQHLIFVKREGPHYPGNVGAHPGTTSQEVLRALIDRARYVNRQILCVETECAIGLLQTALALFEMRAKRVKGQGLNQVTTIAGLLVAPTCLTCGHVYCTENH